MNELKEKSNHQIIAVSDSLKDNKSGKNVTSKVIKIVAIIISVLLLILLVSVIVNITSNKIFANVYIDNQKVSGKTEAKAYEELKQKYIDKNAVSLNIKYDNLEKTIIPLEIGAKYDLKKAINEAYNIGRDANIVTNIFNMVKSLFVKQKIEVNYVYDEDKLDAMIEEISLELPQLVQMSYEVVDNELIIKKGQSGVTINEEEAKLNIVEKLKQGGEQVLEISVTAKMPESIDIEKIHEEIYVKPENARYKKDPFEVIEGKNGIDFAISLEKAKEMLEEDKEEYIIPLKTVSPEVTSKDIGTELCPDLLAKYTTTYIQSKINRTSNLKLAVSKINGAVIMPGETFSYNKAVGERTAAAGFKEAGVYSGGREVQGLGGGICQISSTLYNIVLLSNLEIVERHNHYFLPGYVDAGRDATVVWGALDFKFKNTRDYPIRITGQVSNGYVTMWLYGTKEAVEYDVSIETTYLETLYYKTVYEDSKSLAPGKTKVEQYGKNGCKSKTYKVVKLNGKEVSRTLLSTDTYNAMNKIISRGVSNKTESVSQSKPSSTVSSTAPVQSSSSSTQSVQSSSAPVESSSVPSSSSSNSNSSAPIPNATAVSSSSISKNASSAISS